MKRLSYLATLAAAAAAVLATIPGGAYAAAGDPDPAFGNGGRKVLAVSQTSARLSDVVVQPDGKVVAVGTTESLAGDRDVLVVRLDADGELDPDFANSGVLRINVGADEEATAVALQPDGKLVLAGSTSANSDSIVWRLQPNGNLDLGFGTGGSRRIDNGIAEAFNDVALQSDGKLVLVGHAGTSSRSNMVVYRFTAQGQPDQTFSGDGRTELAATKGYNDAQAVDVQADGKVVVTGTDSDRKLLAVHRLTSAGAADTGFGKDGTGVVTVAGTQPYGFDVRVLPDGTIAALGSTSAGGTAHPYLAMITSAGVLDTSRGGPLSLGGDREFLYALDVDTSGRLVASGELGSAGVVHRFDAEADLDTTYGVEGVAAVPQHSGSAVAVQPDGRIITVGDDRASAAKPVLVRLQAASPAPPPPPTGGGSGPGGPGGPGSATPTCVGRTPTLVGSPGQDHLKGTRGPDVIVGLGGNDRIVGLGGDDVVCAGDGNDKVTGGGGKDVLRGEAGDDRLAGGGGRDRLVGGPGRDRVHQ